MFSVLGLVILSCLSQIALSCTCGHRHPQSAYCDSAVVIRAKFVDKSPSEKSQNWFQYGLKTSKVYKAPENMEEILFVHTASEESLCGYSHQSTNRSEEFIITGYMAKDVMMINSCGFIFPWESLSAAQKMGFKQLYEKSCSCQIVPCYNAPCTTSSNYQCLWTDMLDEQASTNMGPQAVNMTCVDRGTGACVWAKQKQRLLNYFKSKKE